MQLVDLGFISLVESCQKTLKMVSTACVFWGRHLEEVVKNKLASSLVVSLGKPLNVHSYLYVENRRTRHHENGNFQASANVQSKIWRYNLLSREWRINKDNTNGKNSTLNNDINLLTYCKVSCWNCHKRSIRITTNSDQNRRVCIAR